MKARKTTKRLMAFFVILAVTAMFSLQAFASVWTFGTSGSGANAFAPRGYSIDYYGTELWLGNDYYDHDGNTSGNQKAIKFYANGYNEPNELDTVSTDTFTLHAWFDKNPQGSTFPSQVNKTYMDFLVVSVNGGSYVPINTLGTAYNVTISNAVRSSSISDPDGNTNQWCVPISITLPANNSYSFAFLSGVQANNGNTLTIYQSTTTGGVPGYAGYVSTSDTNHLTYYQNNYNQVYEYPVVGSAIGTNSEGYTLYSVSLQPLEHTLTVTT